MILWLLRKLIGEGRFHEPGPRTSSFVRGLVLGALVGAAITGTVWGRRRERGPED